VKMKPDFMFIFPRPPQAIPPTTMVVDVTLV
jgi:hypothetical protein